MRILRLTTPLRGVRLWTVHALLFGAVVLFFITLISLIFSVCLSSKSQPVRTSHLEALNQYSTCLQ